MTKRNQMHEMHKELLRLLIENPAADDAELHRVCQTYSEARQLDKHIKWARNRLKTCIEIYERRMSEPPSQMQVHCATAWAIAKHPDLKGEELRDWVLPRLRKVAKRTPDTITRDYGPQMRDRLAAIAQLSVERRTEIRAALCRRLG